VTTAGHHPPLSPDRPYFNAVVEAPAAYPVAVTPTHLLVDLAGVLATFDRQPRIAALARWSGLVRTTWMSVGGGRAVDGDIRTIDSGADH
jgi:hypothetical protein